MIYIDKSSTAGLCEILSCGDSMFCHINAGPTGHIKQYTHHRNTATLVLLHLLTQIFLTGTIHVADCIVWSTGVPRGVVWGFKPPEIPKV
jgi:hypothetical protein